jgi:TolA-binding protein
MRFLRYPVFLAFLFPAFSFGQNRFEKEMMRDIGLLNEQVRAMQRTLDEKLSALQVLSQQAAENAVKANAALAAFETQFRERLREQEKSVAAPVSILSSKLDQMSTESLGVKESLADLSSRMSKLQAQLADISNAVKTLSAPPAPPPGALPGPGGSASGPPPGVSADSLYQNALRDRTSGNLDLALQGFRDYLNWYGSTDYAPSAQFYIGDILYQRNEYDEALKAFDLVLEKYSENSRTAEARYMKGQTFLKMNQRTAAAQEFRELIRSSPSSPLVPKAQSELKRLGYSAPAVTKKKR